MKQNIKKRTSKKTVFTSLLLVAMTLILTLGIFIMSPMEASAATNRAGVYTISGTYDIGDGSKSGYLSDFRITIATQYFTDDSATVAQTKYNYHTYDWTYFSFYIYANDIDEHSSFKLTRNGSTYTNKTLSGDESCYLYQGSLSDGDYVLTYVGTYWDGIFSKKTYTFTYRFTVDTTSPSVSLKANGSTISSGSYTNKAITFSASDSYSSTKIYYLSPSSSSYTYTTSSSKSVSATSSNNGWWYFYATDGYQSSSTYKVYLDTVAPVGKVTNSSGTTISNGGYTNKPVKYTATDTGGVSYYQVKNPNSSSWSSYSAGTALSSATGWYTFRAVDKANNVSSEYKVYYDATAPTGTLYGGTTVKSSGGYSNASYVKYVASDSHSGVANCYVKKPGSSSYVAYTSGTQLTAEGTYYFYCQDKCGNTSSTVSITLDRSAPTAQLYVDGKAVSSGTYTNGDYIKFVCGEDCFVKMPDSSTFTAYVSGTELNKTGKYVFYGLDDANNSTGNYTIIIDRTIKEVTLSGVTDSKTNGDVVISWTNGSADVYAPITSVKLNGREVTNGATIYTINTGEYVVTVLDAAGNTWTNTFTSAKQNVLTETLQKEYFEVADKDGNIFAFASYEKALEFATARENGYVTTGTWNSSSWDTGIAMDEKDSVNAMNGEYFIYKKSGAASEQVAYFTAERLNEVIAEYAKASIKNYYYWQKAPATAAEGENLYGYADENGILANKIEIGENVGILLDGEEFVGTVIETEGEHILTIMDDYGNSCEYPVTIIRTVPAVQYAVGEATATDLSSERTYYFKNEVAISITDALDEFAMFRVYRVIDEDDMELIGIKSLGEIFTLSESGTYAIIAVNHAGDSAIYKVVISRNAPEISVDANAENKQLVITVKPSVDEESHIQTLIIQKSTDGGETWVELLNDDYGTVIELDTLTYKFRTSGIYKVTLTDEFNTGIDAITKEINYVQPAPTGELEGVENGGHTNGAVKFSWKDEAIVTVEKDGEVMEYRSGTELYKDGSYTVTIENHNCEKSVYTFVIDRENPVVSVEGVSDDKPVKNNVSVSFEEENLTGVLYKDGEEIGAYVSDTVIEEDGAYTLIVKDKANNETEVSFTIDKSVDYDVNINDGGYANSVIVKANEKLDISVQKDGEAIEYKAGDAISEPAVYKVKLTDTLGNTAEISFTVVDSVVKRFEEEIDVMNGYEKVLVNGVETQIERGTLILEEEGNYEVCIVANGKGYTFTVTVDATAPTLILNGVENGGATTDVVILSNVSEEAEVKVFKGDEQIEYTVGDELSEVGEYKVVVTDACGNATEYTFTIEKGANIGLWVILGILALAGIGVGVFFIVKKKNSI